MIYLGLDPGASGGIALLDKDGKPLLTVKCPETERDLWDVVNGAVRDHCVGVGVRAFIERVSSGPGQGVAAMFSFGMSYGALRMALVAAGIPFELVTPQKWQEGFGLPKLPKMPPRLAPGASKEEIEANKKAQKERSAAKRDKKNALKARAQQLFPSVKVTHATADALLIAEWGRRNRA
ncbi:MAG TPA: hypothetical protein VFY93_10455 [Planctomycetota bacterium]|nr:hypothetical protein [Planctomycetota bacterium]